MTFVRRLGRTATPPMLVACLALVVALGSTSYAAVRLTGRTFNLSVDGVLNPPATSCAMGPIVAVNIPAGARISLVSLFLASAASTTMSTLRW